MESLIQDVRYGFRMLRKSPGFTAVAVLTLALGIGANTAVFSVIDGVLLHQLHYMDPQRLVLLWGDSATQGKHRGQVSYTDVEDWRYSSTCFEHVSVFGSWSAILNGKDVSRRVPAIQVSDGFFQALGARPLLGRLFVPEDQVDGKDQVVVISNALWHDRFGSDTHVIGLTIRINAQPYVVIGVLPSDFPSLPQSLVDGQTQIYRPAAEAYNENQRDNRHFRSIARLKPEASLAQAQVQMDEIAAGLARMHAHENSGYGVRVVTMREDLVGDVRPVVLLLYAAVCFVLLIACANVANLLLARAGVRDREIAIRAALGATQPRLVTQLITESILLSLLGSVLGLLVASTIIAATRKIAGHTLMAVDNVTLSPAVLAFTMLTAVLTGTLFGLIPAFFGSKPALVSSLKGSGAAAGNAGRGLLRDLLVVGQVGLALALLICAALLVRSVRRLSSVDPGFDAAGVVSSDIALPYSKYGQTPASVHFYDRLLEQVRSHPGVESAGLVSTLPFTDFDTVGFEFEGQAKSSGRDLDADRYVISPDYLRTMHIVLRSGRSVAVTDTADTSPVVLVNETMGRRIWPDGDVIGKRIRVPGDRPEQPWRTVVGIVADVKQYSLDHQPTMQIYLPYRQVPWNYMTLAVRTTHPAASLLAMLRKQAGTIDADAAFSEPLKLEEILHDSMESRRFTMVMLLGFSLLAVSLASIGIYGVLSYLVTCRTREFGVRLALGASPMRIVTLVMLRGVTLALLGATLGLGLALTASRGITSMLFAVSPRDLGSFVVATIGVVCVALLACYIPAHHASKVDPMVALRYE